MNLEAKNRMESFEASFGNTKQKKKKQKRMRTLMLIGAAVVVLAVGTILIVNATKKSGDATRQINYTVNAVSSGEISTTSSRKPCVGPIGSVFLR